MTHPLKKQSGFHTFLLFKQHRKYLKSGNLDFTPLNIMFAVECQNLEKLIFF